MGHGLLAPTAPDSVRSRLRLAISLAALAAAGCGGAQPLHLEVQPQVDRQQRFAIIFFPDGMDRRKFHELLSRGLLPNIERRFVKGGVGVRTAVACLPAMTYPNTVSLITGRFPGNHGIVGNQWFDRRHASYCDYITLPAYQQVNQDFTCKTLYEMLPDELTVNVQCPARRGVSKTMDNAVATGLAWFVGLFINVDQLVGSCIEQVGMIANQSGRWPSVTMFYFPGIDEIGHQSGSQSLAYEAAMRNIDIQVGRVVDALERANLLDQAYLVLVTDHGHPDSGRKKTFDLVSWLKTYRSLRVHQGPIPGADDAARHRHIADCDAVVVDGSHRSIVIHLRGPAGWNSAPDDVKRQRMVTGEPSASAQSALYDLPCVEVVCLSGGADRVQALSRAGRIEIERRADGSTVFYRVTDAMGRRADDLSRRLIARDAEGFDPGRWHTSQEWLAAGAAADYPDFVPQIAEYFDAPLAGDIVVFLDADWVVAGNGRGEHGTCAAEDMLVPMFFAGPGLPRGATIDLGRLVDVTPTVLDLLGREDRLATQPPLDGVSLAPRLRAAKHSSP